MFHCGIRGRGKRESYSDGEREDHRCDDANEAIRAACLLKDVREGEPGWGHDDK